MAKLFECIPNFSVNLVQKVFKNGKLVFNNDLKNRKITGG